MLSRFSLYRRGNITIIAAGMMIVWITALSSATVSKAGPSIGAYYVMRVPGAADPLPDTVFTRPGVAGVNLRYYWRDLEPRQGRYNWAALDHDLRRAIASGKKFSFGVHSGGFAPAWLYAPGTGIRSIAYSSTPRGLYGCNNYVAPVPYDPPYAAAYTAMLAAVKVHLEAQGALASLAMVKVTPFNNATEELRLPSTPYNPASCQSDAQSAWLALGYRPSLVLGAFQTIYDEMTNIFPRMVFSFNTIQNNSFPGISEGGQKVRRNNDVAEAIISYALSRTPGFVTVEATDLSNRPNDPQLVLWAKGQGAIQGWETNEHESRHSAGCPDRECHVAGYTQLIRLGILTGAPYIEIWPNDALRFSDVLVANPFEIEE